jgi:hypothetical protein
MTDLNKMYHTRYYVASYDCMIIEYWIGKDEKESDRIIISSTTPSFAWRDWGTLRKKSFRIGKLWAITWNPKFLSKKQDVAHSTTTFDHVLSRSLYLYNVKQQQTKMVFLRNLHLFFDLRAITNESLAQHEANFSLCLTN